jgi:hypothetical protein
MTRSLQQLERYLRGLKESGKLPALSDHAQDAGKTRPPRSRAAG